MACGTAPGAPIGGCDPPQAASDTMKAALKTALRDEELIYNRCLARASS
jgi:hypothetical protein